MADDDPIVLDEGIENQPASVFLGGSWTGTVGRQPRGPRPQHMRAGPIAFDISIEGLAELDAQLAQFEPTVRRRLASKALREGARLIRDRARKNCPVKTGTLRDSIRVRTGRVKAGQRLVRVLVTTGAGLFKGETFYGGFIEFGTSHAPAYPFIRPAFDAEAPFAVHRIATALGRGIDKMLASKGATG